MVLLFMDSHIKPILEGRKTRTTRIWKRRRVKPEGVYQARTELFGKPFALLRVKDVWRQEFNSLSLDTPRRKDTAVGKSSRMCSSTSTPKSLK